MSRRTRSSSSSSSSGSKSSATGTSYRAEQRKLKSRKRRRRELRSQKLHQSTLNEFIPGYQQGRILGRGSFGAAWTLVKNVEIRETKEKEKEKEKDGKENNVPHVVTTTTTTTTVTTTIQPPALNKDKQQQEKHPLDNKTNVPDNWILKVSTMQGDRDGRLKDTFDREVFYLRHLANAVPKMTPRLLHAGILDKNGLQIMERFEDTIKVLGQSQARGLGIPGRTSQAYTWKQLRRILELARQLDSMGIIHGDLKHSNMLFRWKDGTKNPNEIEICVCDFGFTGTTDGHQYHPLIGFMRHYGCNPKRTIHWSATKLKSHKSVCAGGILQPRFKLAHSMPSTLLPVMNRCQLYIALAEQTRLYIWEPEDRKFMRCSAIELLKMMELNDPHIIELFQEYCPRMRTLPTTNGSYFTKLMRNRNRYEFDSRRQAIAPSYMSLFDINQPIEKKTPPPAQQTVARSYAQQTQRRKQQQQQQMVLDLPLGTTKKHSHACARRNKK